MPNPASGPQAIELGIDARQPASALTVYDVFGRLVWRASLKRPGPGVHRLEWDGRGQGGAPVPAGVYRMRLETANGRTTQGSFGDCVSL